MIRWVGVGTMVGLLALVTGCAIAAPPTNSSQPTASEATPAPILGPLGAPGCAPASPIGTDSAFPEVQGTPTQANNQTSLYGWIMAKGVPPIRVGVDVKVVWRMPGEGNLRVQLLNPDGAEKALAWGPEEHSGSNYVRPGREWGTGFVLNSPGCWELRLATDTTAAAVWIDVPA